VIETNCTLYFFGQAELRSQSTTPSRFSVNQV
jgi:hypothetical protein